MHPTIYGILTGLVFILFVGPSFFYLIGVGMKQGFKKAGLFAAGIIISDMMLLLAIFYGLSKFFESQIFQKTFSLFAGIAILYIGYQYLTKHVKHSRSSGEADLPLMMYLFKGFAINFINPFTVLVWVGILGTLNIQEEYTEQEYYFFFTGLLSTIFCIDLMKAFLAKRLGEILNEKIIQKIDRVLGIIFILLSVNMFYNFLRLTFGWEWQLSPM